MSAGTPPPRTKDLPATAQRRHYRIELHGQVDQHWVAAFDPVSFSSSVKITRLEVRVDQAGLRGILNRLWDLNLALLSVTEIAGPTERNGDK